MADLNDVLVFAAVADAGSFTSAARRLDMPKSTVSRKVSQLEERLGARLLQRTTRKLSLTDVGRIYFDHARRIADELHQGELAVSRQQESPRGLLRLTLPLDFAYLRPIIASFLLRHPEVDIDMVCTDRVIDLVEEGFDLSIRAGSLSDSTLIARRLGTMRSHVVASPAFLARHKSPKSPADLSHLPGILFGAGTARDGWLLVSGDQRLTVTPHTRLTVNEFAMVRETALAGLGVAMIPADTIADDLKSGHLVNVLCDWSSPAIPVHALYPSTRHLPLKLKAFLEHLQAQLTPSPWSIE